MTMKHSLIFTIGTVALLLVAGCADVTTTQKVGDFGTAFGTTTEEQQAINWFKATYGDPMTNNGDPPRFIEPLVTSGISSKTLPVDKVAEFPASGGSVYFFVIYDNFQKGHPITVSWTYLENGKEVTRVSQQAGGDFGRFIVEFQKPDSGWGKGKQRISVSGDGISSDAEFIIGNNLVTVPLPYNPVTGKETPVTTSTIAAHATGTLMPATTLTIPATVQLTPTAADCPYSECNGICTHLGEDDENCGACGSSCSAAMGVGSHCYHGECEDPCPRDLHSCGSRETDATWCNIDLKSDPHHCGSCDIDCAVQGTNVTATCFNSKCI